jgi:hypothetical protein
MKIGDRVILNSTSVEFMTQWRDDANSAVGVIIKRNGSIHRNNKWRRVKFPNGYENLYRDEDLELVGHHYHLDASEYEEIMTARELIEGK